MLTNRNSNGNQLSWAINWMHVCTIKSFKFAGTTKAVYYPKPLTKYRCVQSIFAGTTKADCTIPRPLIPGGNSKPNARSPHGGRTPVYHD